MKAFDKWWIKEKEIIYNGIPNYVAARAENLSHINDKEVWRAALVWVLTLKEPDHTDIFEVINPIWIKKELDE